MKTLRQQHDKKLRALKAYKRKHKTTRIQNATSAKELSLEHFTQSVRAFALLNGPQKFEKKYPHLYKELEKLSFDWD